MFALAALGAAAVLTFLPAESQAQRRGGFAIRSPGGWGFGYGDAGFRYGNYYGGRYGYGYGYGYPGMYGGLYDRPSYYYGTAPYRSSYTPTYYDRFYYDSAPTYSTYPSTTSAAAIGSLNVEVRVPREDARVWINGQASTQRGTSRWFEVSSITPGRTYTYEVRASWMEDGKEVSRTKTVQGTAGDNLTVTFP